MHRSVPAALALVAAMLTGCQWDGQACTLIGGVSGIYVEIDQELWLAEGDMSFTVCDDEGCESATQHLPVRPKRITGGLPEERSASVDFEDLGRSFDDGTVQVLVELRDTSGRLVASRTADVELTRDWPNGKDCDGDGFLSGRLDLRPEDAVTTSS